MADEYVWFVLMKMTLLLPLLVLLIPAAVVAKMLGLEVDARSAAAVNVSPRVVLVLGLALIAVAVGAGWYGYGKASANVAFEAFNLSNSQVPQSTHVVMTGVAHTEYQVEFETKSGGSTSLDRYIPITAANWRRGDPLVYFVKTNATVYMPPEGGKSFEFSRARLLGVDSLRSTKPDSVTKDTSLTWKLAR